MIQLFVILSGTLIVWCVICRLSLVSFRAHNPIVLCCYIAFATWAAARGMETLAGQSHTFADMLGLGAVSIYLLADMRRWKRGVPISLYRREGDRSADRFVP
jgi:hypothetical protein